MNWEFNSKEINSLAELESIVTFPLYGFIYKINYEDNTSYIGMKPFKSKVTLPALLNGEVREGATRVCREIKRREDGSVITSKAEKKGIKAKREYFDVLYKESSWKTYKGSCTDPEVKNLKIVSKEILMLAQSKRHLSYLENYFLYSLGCIEPGSTYRNSNIAGKYFKGNLI